MEIQDRSPIAEELIFQLWERNYFSTLELKTDDGRSVQIVSIGQRNRDSGPDFKDIAIKIEDQIYHGDLEIHRSANDWYLHKHHHDSAYNEVILHLVIGSEPSPPVILRLNQQPVLAQVFVDISDEQISYLTPQYRLSIPIQTKSPICIIKEYRLDEKLIIIEKAGLLRLTLKAERFKEERQQNSWNQIAYLGIMEALGYSKNQRPFRKLAQLLPVEVIFRELFEQQQSSLMNIQALLFGVAGLLPSQDPKLLIKDEATLDFVDQLEAYWQNIQPRIGVTPMSKEAWQFFRLRPTNFPTRRLAAASYILTRFLKFGLLETFLKIFDGLKNNPDKIIEEIEKLFICSTDSFWADHYLFSQAQIFRKQATLIGIDRARDISVNIVLPVLLAFAEETENGHLKSTISQVYHQYPKLSPNQITGYMSKLLLTNDPRSINTALKQQGLIHLYKMYCKNKACERCFEFVTNKD